MFQVTRTASWKLSHKVSKTFLYVTFSSTARNRSTPNPPLHLDQSFQALLSDIDISLKKPKDNLMKHKELEIVSGTETPHFHDLPSEEWSPMDLQDNIQEDVEHESRKSPAALFGSDQIGAVILPRELCSAINMIVSESQKALLHSDAKRLFLSSGVEDDDANVWDTHYDKVYRTRRQAAQHAVRDGTAFATVALPAHYSAIASVLHHAKLRLGPSWSVERIIDWGAGTGSGLWASLYSFQSDIAEVDHEAYNPTAAMSGIRSYLGIEKREGLVSIGRRLVDNIPTDNLTVTWQKSFREHDVLPQEDARSTVALSAFMLTTLPTAIAQKTLVEEMWTSGAHTLILIDHDTPEGFKAIAHAREHLLELGRLETEESGASCTGCHILAPCPHDRLCPLLHAGGTPLICGFSQRFQSPSFLRQTKHSRVGHEDIRYSYVVLRRGRRPNLVETSVGRVGGIGLRVLKGEFQNVLKELEVHVEDQTTSVAPVPDDLSLTPIPILTGLDLQNQLRQEAYQWPRLVFPPLKKSGHIILDACTAEGKIMRLTIPRSQGKQPFYDARKSNWGDIFPHPPKNAPQERYQPKTYRKGDRPPSGDDIGKRKELHQKRMSYTDIADQMKERKKLSKRDYARIREDKVWHGMS